MAKQKRKPRWVEMAEENEQAAKDAAREAEIQNRANNQSGGSSSSTSQDSGKGLGGLFSSAVQTIGAIISIGSAAHGAIIHPEQNSPETLYHAGQSSIQQERSDKEAGAQAGTSDHRNNVSGSSGTP